ncbi:tRNA guanosine(34) transglycosylase Tgt [Patescibacteria group bacterium]
MVERFKLVKNKKNNLRKGIIKTVFGEIQTPFFMPDATRGYVKSVSMEDLEKVGVSPMVVNTLHLYLQPGIDVIKSVKSVKAKVAEGVHSFMSWSHPLISDSGGFQVFSLIYKKSGMGKIYDDKVVFKSPIDGSRHIFTPEKSIQIQFDLGTDMIVCLDDCPPNEFNKDCVKKSVERTIKWAKKCRKEYNRQIKKRKLKNSKRPLLFSVIQGGNFKDLRKYCADELVKIGFDGYGFGARPVDENGNRLEDILEYTAGLIPENALRFALGVGTPEDIIKCVSYGWDMFDCVIPTREARHGKLFLGKTSNLCHSRESGNPVLNTRISKNGSRSSRFGQSEADIKCGMTVFEQFGINGVKKFYDTININNAKFSKDFSAINENSKLPELRNHTKAYLHHLFKMKESLGSRLASLNNLEFYMDLMDNIRK